MSNSGHRYFIINKPYNMVSQFISPDKVRLLGDLDFDFPEGTHAVGRLDNHSEGLLILTTNKKVTRLLFESEQPHKRTYLVMVKNIVSQETVEQLQQGVTIRIKGGVDWVTTPCQVEIVEKPPYIKPREQYPLKEFLPHSWLLITLTEGKYHQVRKMTSAIRHHCDRLIRVSIEDLELGDLPPGGVKEMEEAEFFRLLKIENWQPEASILPQ
ncbi:pseudouridine synthase [Chitinophaga filiformis]|uniref:Pseudouridine synthase n=1 Tax=Chitinophaga filiformis TaxID=104663 RepID=A0A1G7NAR8_CHIFI|nr:pseudouridine synthase [Chitinophaga filiformis]SDF71094.1 23S rRNA pseudouridine2457 synthase [Chitinophaga filiformis]